MFHATNSGIEIDGGLQKLQCAAKSTATSTYSGLYHLPPIPISLYIRITPRWISSCIHGRSN